MSTAPKQVVQRKTRQRSAVSELLSESEDFRTAQQLHEQLRTRGYSIGLTTVYRTLQAMAEAGELDTIRNDTELAYRRCVSQGHHHHLVCRRCGKAVELETDLVEKWASKIAEEYGFRDVDHELELFGLCANCYGK